MIHRKGEVAFALLYHDAIYDTHAQDNEERSAELAVEVLDEYTAIDRDIADRVRSLILVTKHDAQPASQDEQILVDIDLAILGASQERFDEYEQQVRREYAWVNDSDFRPGRSRILKQFLDRPQLYATAYFRGKLEQSARNNLSRSLQRLST
jgi:predicted metal-dependent HD superfamily phosphohydrolase